MKRYILLSLLIIIGKFGIAQYKPINNGSSVKFEIENFGVTMTGTFTGLEGNIYFDKDHPENAKFTTSIDANSINTDNSIRDNHLREESYFDVKEYPHIDFVSTKIVSSLSGELTIFGKLTIKGQTKDISFPFTATKNNTGYLFKGSFNINRKDFGVGGTSTISNNLNVQLSIQAAK